MADRRHGLAAMLGHMTNKSFLDVSAASAQPLSPPLPINASASAFLPPLVGQPMKHVMISSTSGGLAVPVATKTDQQSSSPVCTGLDNEPSKNIACPEATSAPAQVIAAVPSVSASAPGSHATASCGPPTDWGVEGDMLVDEYDAESPSQYLASIGAGCMASPVGAASGGVSAEFSDGRQALGST